MNRMRKSSFSPAGSCASHERIFAGFGSARSSEELALALAATRMKSGSIQQEFGEPLERGTQLREARRHRRFASIIVEVTALCAEEQPEVKRRSPRPSSARTEISDER